MGKMSDMEVIRGRGIRLRMRWKTQGTPLTPEHHPREGVNGEEFLQLWIIISVHLSEKSSLDVN